MRFHLEFEELGSIKNVFIFSGQSLFRFTFNIKSPTTHHFLAKIRDIQVLIKKYKTLSCLNKTSTY